MLLLIGNFKRLSVPYYTSNFYKCFGIISNIYYGQYFPNTLESLSEIYAVFSANIN